MRQFRVASDPPASLAIAKEMVKAKLRNSRVMAAPQPSASAGSGVGRDKAIYRHGGYDRLFRDAARHRRRGGPGLLRQLRGE